MSQIALTAPEHAELLGHADVAEPAHRDRIVGKWAAQKTAEQPLSYERTSGLPIPPAYTCNAYDLVEGEVEIAPDRGHHMLDVTGATLSVATAEKVLAGVGERGPNRRFSLRFAFSRFGDGR